MRSATKGRDPREPRGSRAPREVRFRVVSRILALLDPGFVPLREHILLVEKSLFSRKPNNSVLLRGGIRVRRVYGDLIFTKKAPFMPPPIREEFDIAPGRNDLAFLGVTLHVASFDIAPEKRGATGLAAAIATAAAEGEDRQVIAPQGEGQTALFDAARIGRLTVRTFRDGDRFTPLGMDRPVKVKDFFISRKIPRQRRRQIPLLLSDGEIIWVVGVRMDDTRKITPETTRVVRVRAE